MLNILSGQDTANVKSFPVALLEENSRDYEKSQTKIDEQGTWVMFDEEGFLKIQEGEYDGSYATFPVYAGNKIFFDTRYHARVDVVTAKSCVLETDVTEATGITAGTMLTVKDGKLAEASAAGPGVIGFAIENQKGKVVKFILQ